jgi:hypothetical protein
MMAEKPIFYIVGDENGNVYSHIKNTIYAREHFRDGSYGKTHSVEIPEEFLRVPFYHAERILLSFEGNKAYFRGKDFRNHISQIYTADDNPMPPRFNPSHSYTIKADQFFGWIMSDEDKDLGTSADAKGKSLLDGWTPLTD